MKMKQPVARQLGGGETARGPGGHSNNIHILRSKAVKVEINGSKRMEDFSWDGKTIRFEFLIDCAQCSTKNKFKVGNTECGEDPIRSYST